MIATTDFTAIVDGIKYEYKQGEEVESDLKTLAILKNAGLLREQKKTKTKEN
jgi:hypothetical protein